MLVYGRIIPINDIHIIFWYIVVMMNHQILGINHNPHHHIDILEIALSHLILLVDRFPEKMS